MNQSIWKTLSAIDCNKHIEKKGKFSYLAWTWAWAMVKENYPEATYEIMPDITYLDGTMEVRVTVVVTDRTSTHPNILAHTMWLPVLDFKNNAIKNPNAFDINSTRMRCLVKCLAMFGLGHYIYAGESMPQERVIEETPEMIRAGAAINVALENDDYHGAIQLWEEWSQEELAVIARAASKGGQFTPASRVKMKSTAFRHALNESRGISMDGLE